jgi:hypothetical protein
MPGDTLARGGKSAQFGPPKCTQEQWDRAFSDKSNDETSTSKEEIDELPVVREENPQA